LEVELEVGVLLNGAEDLLYMVSIARSDHVDSTIP
jgi:hypothetical protein